MNQLYFGDNLNVLRDHIVGEAVFSTKSPKVTGRVDLPVSRGDGEAAQQRRPLYVPIFCDLRSRLL